MKHIINTLSVTALLLASHPATAATTNSLRCFSGNGDFIFSSSMESTNWILTGAGSSESNPIDSTSGSITGVLIPPISVLQSVTRSDYAVFAETDKLYNEEILPYYFSTTTSNYPAQLRLLNDITGLSDGETKALKLRLVYRETGTYTPSDGTAINDVKCYYESDLSVYVKQPAETYNVPSSLQAITYQAKSTAETTAQTIGLLGVTYSTGNTSNATITAYEITDYDGLDGKIAIDNNGKLTLNANQTIDAGTYTLKIKLIYPQTSAGSVISKTLSQQLTVTSAALFTQLDGCVKDEGTGLMWETKVGSGAYDATKHSDQGYHDKDASFLWYQPGNDSVNGGWEGNVGAYTCYGSVYGGDLANDCNTTAFVNRVNNTSNSLGGICGMKTGWRLPTKDELTTLRQKLIDNSTSANDLRSVYFPQDYEGAIYWTSDFVSNNVYKAYGVSLHPNTLSDSSGVYEGFKQGLLPVRLVHD